MKGLGAYETGLKLLSARGRTRAKLAELLQARGFGEIEVQAALDRLDRLGYLNDEAHASAMARGWLLEHRSRADVLARLEELGLASGVASRVLTLAIEEVGYRELFAASALLAKKGLPLGGLENIWGDSRALHEVLETIKQVAPSSANVLIEGESGTGKELAAHAIHNLSRRNKAKFVVVHCAALSPQLLESELFGHEKGAFTGAHERRIGRFEQASGGTIFLDEIAEIDASTQVKLLRVMSEERAFERVGGNQPLRADVRLIAATNKNLEQMVREGKFRDDLYFRLNVVRIVMPPLRERKEDIPILVRGFLRHFCKENQKPLLELVPDAMDALLAYDWPGNIRELRTAIEHGVVMATDKQITLRDLPMAVRQAATVKLPGGVSPTEAFGAKASPLDLHETERRLIAQALAGRVLLGRGHA